MHVSRSAILTLSCSLSNTSRSEYSLTRVSLQTLSRADRHQASGEPPLPVVSATIPADHDALDAQTNKASALNQEVRARALARLQSLQRDLERLVAHVKAHLQAEVAAAAALSSLCRPAERRDDDSDGGSAQRWAAMSLVPGCLAAERQGAVDALESAAGSAQALLGRVRAASRGATGQPPAPRPDRDKARKAMQAARQAHQSAKERAGPAEDAEDDPWVTEGRLLLAWRALAQAITAGLLTLVGCAVPAARRLG